MPTHIRALTRTAAGKNLASQSKVKMWQKQADVTILSRSEEV